MNDKIAKEIAKELRLIRIELQKMNARHESVELDTEKLVDTVEEYEVQTKAGERVTI